MVKSLFVKLKSLQIMKLVLAGFMSFFVSVSVFANPVLDNIAAGQVSISNNASATVVNQASQKAIINWQSFNIGANESTHFQQPQGGIALNRINPAQGASQIFGRLTATGQIILVNPAGIFFAPGSYVNVGGLIASTANISDSDFLNDYYHFANDGNYRGAIVNQGTIIAADNGLIALIGGAVSNEGYIQANMGHAILASGNSFTMTFAGNDLVSFAVDSGVHTRSLDQSGNELRDGVSNSGSIYAAGGRIQISARDAAGVLDRVINMSGIAVANNVHDGATPRDGEIILLGGDQAGVAVFSGSLMSAGGSIIVKAYDLRVADGARIDVSSLTGDGGFIETSGTHAIQLGAVEILTSAANGRAGTWLIDPADLTITTFDNGITSVPPYTPTTTGSMLNAATLMAALENGNVTVLTTLDPYTGSGNITVASPVTWLSANKLLLDAYNNIIINAPITATNGALEVRAGGSNNTITTGVEGEINVANFNLLRGQWTQTANLPAFNVSNNFQINSGSTIPSSIATFIRASSGDGSEAAPYVLVDIYGVQGIGSNSETLSKHYLLGNHIDAGGTQSWNSGAGFVPIGTASNDFYGSLNGDSYGINGVYINRTQSNTGLFGVTDSLSVIKNFSLTNVDITSNNPYLGGLVGYNQGEINNVIVSGSITNTYTGQYAETGGMVGQNAGLIINSYANVVITALASDIGGLVGWHDDGGTISNSFSSGTINTSGDNAGGLVGWNNSDIINSYSTVNVTGDGSVGGLVGINADYGVGGTIANSYSTGVVSGNSFVGGLVGFNETGAVSNSFWNSDTSGLTVSDGSTNQAGYRGMTSAEMKSLANFTQTANGFVTQAWSVGAPGANQTWYLDGSNFPSLSAFLRTISGNAAANTNIKLIANGNEIAQAVSDGSGLFNFYLSRSALPDRSAFLLYQSNNGLYANVVGVAPASGGNLVGGNAISLLNNSLVVGVNGVSAIYSHDLLGGIKGNINDNYIVYSLSGNDLNLASGMNFITTANNKYLFGGNLTTVNGNITLNAETIVNSFNPVNIVSAGSLTTGAITYHLPSSLTLMAASGIQINGAINGTTSGLVIVADNDGVINTSANAHINVAQFTLQEGNWMQIMPVLPFFNSYNDFQLTAGTSFVRATGGNGSQATPYLIGDVYALQAIGISVLSLAQSYQLTNSINASVAGIWNNENGFKPIGNSTQPFTGHFNGANFNVANLTLNSVNNSPTGLFGVIGASGSVSGLGVILASVNANNPVNDPAFASGILAGVNHGSIASSYSSGNVYGGYNNYYIGGLVGFNSSSGVINRSYSIAAVNAIDGNQYVGGLVGASAGSINDSYSRGMVSTYNSQKIGGMVGALLGGTSNRNYSSGVVNTVNGSFDGGLVGVVQGGVMLNSFWDMVASGKSTSAAGAGLSTSQMKNSTTFTGAGWDLINVWGMVDGQSYPYLRGINANLLRQITGNAPAASSVVNLVANGILAGTTTTNTSGDYSLFFTGEDLTPILVYLDNAGTLASALTLLPVNGANLSGANSLMLTANTVAAGNVGVVSAPIGNTDFSEALGNYSDTDVLFAMSGNNLQIASGASFFTRAGAVYKLDGDITTTGGGNITFNAAVFIPVTNNISVTSGNNLTMNQINFAGGNALSLAATNSILLNGAINAPNGTLNLTAAATIGSIAPTSLTVVNLANFNLSQGYWSQNNTTLPVFNVSNNFTVGTGLLPSVSVNFTRVAGGDGSVLTPFVIMDKFGLQGIAANTLNFNFHYELGADIDLSGIAGWSNNAGFKPIGTLANKFNGVFDGLNHTISNFRSVIATSTEVGLFGSIDTAGVIKNIVFTNPVVYGEEFVGTVVGMSYGQVDNITITGGSVQSAFGNVGGIVGNQIDGSLSNLIVNNMSVISPFNAYIGGVAGYTDMTVNSNLHNNSTYVAGESYVGGVIGEMWGGTATNLSNSGTVGTPNQYSSSLGGVIGDAFNGAIITNAMNTGLVISNTGDFVGGVIGYLNNSSITQSYNIGDVITSSIAGGVVGGADQSVISYSYNTGNITVRYGEAGGISGKVFQTNVNHVYNTGSVLVNGLDSTPILIGGIVGYNQPQSSITYAYNYGYVGGNENGASGQFVGGISGYSYSTGATLGNLYNTGMVQGTTNTGALVGYMDLAPTYAGNSYWNADTSGVVVAVGNASPVQMISKTTAEMKQQATYTGWDFTAGSANWNIIENISYPVMRFYYPDISTARVFSGTTDLAGGKTVALANAGENIAYASTGADGSFYFFVGANALSGAPAIADNALMMAYYYNQPTVSNYLFGAPSNYGSLTNINLGSNILTAVSGSLSNTNLSLLIGDIVTDDILFSLDGTDLMLGNASSESVTLIVGSNLTYDINGNISTYNVADGSNIIFNSPVTVSGDYTVNLGNGALSFNNTLNGAQNLTLTSSGTIALAGDVGGVTPLASLMLNGGGVTTIGAQSITTSGDQTYANPLAFTADTDLLIGSGATLSLLDGASGAQSVLLSGAGSNTYEFDGLFTAVNLNVNGGGSNNTLTSESAGVQTWSVTAADAGAIGAMNLVFNGIQNLTGGSLADFFNFTEGASISGNIDGGDTTTINNINFNTYVNNVTLRLAMPVNNIIDAGAVYGANNTLISTFTQVQMSQGNGTSYIILPNKSNITVTYYDSTFLNGEIADPFYFSGYIISTPAPVNPPSSTGGANISGSASSAVANIVNQPETNAENNNDYSANSNDASTNYNDLKNLTSTNPLLQSATVKAGNACYQPEQVVSTPKKETAQADKTPGMTALR